MAAKKAAPGGTDLIAALVAVQQTEGRVTRDELRNLVVTLVFAAHDNMRYQFANTMVAFAEHPKQWTLLARHPELAAQAVEELMRWCPRPTRSTGSPPRISTTTACTSRPARSSCWGYGPHTAIRGPSPTATPSTS